MPRLHVFMQMGKVPSKEELLFSVSFLDFWTPRLARGAALGGGAVASSAVLAAGSPVCSHCGALGPGKP